MIFSELYRSPRSPFSKLRSSHPQPVALPPDLDADLVSKDKVRQKEAVRRLLADKVRNDWDFVWPPVQPPPEQTTAAPCDAPLPAPDVVPVPMIQDAAEPVAEPASGPVVSPDSAPAANNDDPPRDPGEEADSESDAESVYSTMSEDLMRFRPRDEWTSDLSDDDEPRASASPFRFDSPDAVGAAVNCSLVAKQTRRRRAVREETAWNPGLACFEARRAAWTGAKTCRVKPKPPSPASPSSPRRLFWRHHRSESAASNAGVSSGSPPSVSSPLSPATTRTSHQTDASTVSHPPSELESSNSVKATSATGVHRTSSQGSSHSPYPVETLVPIAPPLLPAQNPMRASVTPSIYPSLYDKIVIHSLQPSCPVNLGDMLRACVVGWKRDGEWPPKPTMAPPSLTATDLAAIRHRKAAAAHQQHARKGSTATNMSSRRLSFGFLGGSSREDKENGSDEGAGKTIRRSLQKVFSLGHQHSHSNPPSQMFPGTTPSAAEATAAGRMLSAGCL